MSERCDTVERMGQGRSLNLDKSRNEYGPWTLARFGTEKARDTFLNKTTALPSTHVESKTMPAEPCAALIRWRPGQFLKLNDLAHTYGGRIILFPSP